MPVPRTRIYDRLLNPSRDRRVPWKIKFRRHGVPRGAVPGGGNKVSASRSGLHRERASERAGELAGGRREIPDALTCDQFYHAMLISVANDSAPGNESLAAVASAASRGQ